MHVMTMQMPVVNGRYVHVNACTKSGNFLQCNIFGKQRKTLFVREKFSVPHALPL